MSQTEIINIEFPRASPSGPITKRVLCGVWVAPEFAAAIDRWRVTQPDYPSRVEAIRRLTALGLAGSMLEGR
jgi:hypothetical protein